MDADIGIREFLSPLTGLLSCFVMCQVLLIFRFHMSAICNCYASPGWERECEWRAAALSRVREGCFGGAGVACAEVDYRVMGTIVRMLLCLVLPRRFLSMS